MGRPRELLGQVPGRDRRPRTFRQKAASWERGWDSLGEVRCVGGEPEPRCVAISSDRLYP